MGVDAGTPPGLADRIRQMVQQELAKFARSGFLRNASISDGGLTIKGGFFRLLSKVDGGVTQFYLGPTGDVLANGERQQIWRVRRADGTSVLYLYDAFPGDDGTLNQALSWVDRAGNVVFADDTDSGQGIARPYFGPSFYRNRYADWVTVTGTDFETTHTAVMNKQHPQLFVQCQASNDTTAATGEVRVLVNGQPWAQVAVTAFQIATLSFGPLPVDGEHMAPLKVELQARRVSGSGGVRLEPSVIYGRQT